MKVELHISNPEAREHWRHDSVISPYMTATMAGLRRRRYRLADRRRDRTSFQGLEAS